MLKDKLTILLNTCDKYYEAWELYFTLLKKYGGELAQCKNYIKHRNKNF